MPRDAWLMPDRCSTPCRSADVLLPVPSPAAVWTQARREFAIERIERLPLRARLLDVLEHLNRGHTLVLTGSTTASVWLDSYPDIALLAGVLFTYEYVEIAGRHRDNSQVVCFALSAAGRRKLREGRAWWNRLSLGQRLRVRLFG